MIFPVLISEPIVQVGDRTRFDASGSYTNSSQITKIEIDVGFGYVNITGPKFYDTQFDTDGEKTITLRINDNITKSFTIDVISAEDDLLFSDDAKLIVYEPNIMLYVRQGRNSYKDVHRRVQGLILDWLDSNRFWKSNGDRFTKADLVDLQDFREWAAFYALKVIFEGLSDKVDDKWAVKAARYTKLGVEARQRGTFRLDRNGDGSITSGERVDNISKGLIRQ
jgi:hypothetical protein